MGKSFRVKGKTYSEAEVAKAAADQGWETDAYTKQMGMEEVKGGSLYSYQGKDYSEDEVAKAAADQGWTVDDYVKQIGFEKKNTSAPAGSDIVSQLQSVGESVKNKIYDIGRSVSDVFGRKETSAEKIERQRAIAAMDYNGLLEASKQRAAEYDRQPLLNRAVQYLTNNTSREEKVLQAANNAFMGMGSADDLAYVKAAAPKVYQQLKQTAQVGDGPDEAATLLAKNRERSEQELSKSIGESVKKSIDENAAVLGQLGVNMARMGERNYAKFWGNKFASDAQAEASKRAQERAGYATDPENPFSTFGPKDYDKETEAIKQEAAAKKMAVAQLYAQAKLQSSNAEAPDAVQLGMEMLEITDPEKHAQLKQAKAGNSSFYEAEMLALPILIAAATYPETKRSLIKRLNTLDEKYPFYKKVDEVKARLGAELHKRQNVVFSRTTIADADKAAEQMSSTDRAVYDRYVRPEIMGGALGALAANASFAAVSALNPTIRSRGFVNSVIEGFAQPLEGIFSYLQNSNATGSERINEQLNRPYKSDWHSKGGEFAPAIVKLEQLNKKQRDEGLTANELKERDDIKSYTNYVSGVESFTNSSASILGNVVGYAMLTQGFGLALKPLLSAGAGALNAGGRLGFEMANAAAGIAGGRIAGTAGKFLVDKAVQNNAGGFLAGYLSSMEGHKTEAAMLYPNSESKQWIYGQAMGLAESLSERIYKDEKIFDAFKGRYKVNLAKALAAVNKNSLSELATRTLVKQAVRDAARFAAVMGVEASKESMEEAAVEAVDMGLKMIMSPKTTDYKKEAKDIVTTFADTFISMGIPAAMSARSGYKENRVTVPLVASIGRDAELTNSLVAEIRRQQRDGTMSQQVAMDKMRLINELKEANKATWVMAEVLTDERPLTTREFDKYVVMLANERTIEAQMADVKDPVAKQALQKRIKDSQAIREEMISGSGYVNEDYELQTPEAAKAEADAKAAAAVAAANALIAETQQDVLYRNDSLSKTITRKQIADFEANGGKLEAAEIGKAFGVTSIQAQFILDQYRPTPADAELQKQFEAELAAETAKADGENTDTPPLKAATQSEAPVGYAIKQTPDGVHLVVDNKTDKPVAVFMTAEEANAYVASKTAKQPDAAITNTDYDAARKAGTLTVDGVTYTRNEPVQMVMGKAQQTKFSDTVMQGTQFAVAEADTVQAAHTNTGQRNPSHFIGEGQPKERTDAVSQGASNNIANNPNFDEITQGISAYTGAPIVNARGEVIQGNNRTTGLKKHYSNGGTIYKAELIARAAEFGLDPAEIAKMKNPVLVRVASVEDAKAIELGNYDVKDTETGGNRRIDPVATSRKIPFADKLAVVRNIIGNADDTLKANIRSGWNRVQRLLAPKYISPSQLNSMVDADGNLRPQAIDDIHELIKHFLFEGGDVRLPMVFDALPNTITQGIYKSMPAIFNTPAGAGILTEIQNAAILLYNVQQSGADSVQAYMAQDDMFDPNKRNKYSPADVALATKLMEAKAEKNIRQLFRTYESLVNGVNDFFEQRAPLEKVEAMQQWLGVAPVPDAGATIETTNTLINTNGDGKNTGQNEPRAAAGTDTAGGAADSQAGSAKPGAGEGNAGGTGQGEGVQGNPATVAELRAAEQAEYAAMTDPNDEAKRKEIYDRYDKLITPLLKEEGGEVESRENQINSEIDKYNKRAREIDSEQSDITSGTGKYWGYDLIKGRAEYNKLAEELNDLNRDRDALVNELKMIKAKGRGTVPLFIHWNTDHGSTNTVFLDIKENALYEKEETAKGKTVKISIEDAAKKKFIGVTNRGKSEREINEAYTKEEQIKYENKIIDQIKEYAGGVLPAEAAEEKTAPAPDKLKELEKSYRGKSVDELVALKKELYPNQDIETPMSPEEKLLNSVIADKFSDLNRAIGEKRKAEKAKNEEANQDTPTPTQRDEIDDAFDDFAASMGVNLMAGSGVSDITPIAPDSPRAKAIVENINRLFKKVRGFAGVRILSQADFAAVVDESNGKGTFTNNNGQVYGMEYKGVIYLNAALMNANTPVHEASHVFLKWAKQNNQALYKQGLEIARNSPYYAEVKRNPAYANASEPVQAEEALAWMVGAMGDKMKPGVRKNALLTWWDKFITAVTEAIHGYKLDSPAQLLAYMNGFRLKRGIAIEKSDAHALQSMNWLEFGYAFADRIVSGKPLSAADLGGDGANLMAGERVASYFSGAGTMEAALGDVASVMAVEFNPEYMKAYNNANGTSYKARDVNNISSTEVMAVAPEIFHASPVCKNFSAAKNIKTVERSDMDSALAVARVIRDAVPPVVTIENVPAYQDTAPFNAIVDALKAAGYKYDIGVYNAADFGGVQNRSRLLVRAVISGNLPAIPEKQQKGDWFKAVGDLIDNAPDAAFTARKGDVNWEQQRIAKMVAAGLLDATKPIITMGGSAFAGQAQAVNAGNPAPTLKSTSREVPRIILPNGTVKRVTPEMMKRIMGLPESYKLPADPIVAKEVLGNGIDGAFTKALIAPLLDNVEGQRPRFMAGTPTDASKMTEEQLDKGRKLVDLYIKKGIYKFEAIAADAMARLGDGFAPIFDGMKSAYSNYYNMQATDEVADKMDAAVRQYKYDIIKQKSLSSNAGAEKTDDRAIKFTFDNSKQKENGSENKQQPGEQGISDSGGALQPNRKRLPAGKSQEILQQPIGEQGAKSGSREQGKAVPGANGNIKQPSTRQGDLFSTNAGVLGTEKKTVEPKAQDNAEVEVERINQAEKQEPALVDFSMQDNEQERFNAAKKYTDNINALETLLTIIKEKREATTEEKNNLAKYVGFGGLKEISFNPDNEADWKDSTAKYRLQVRRVIELTQELDKALGINNSLSEIRAGILTAHYTPKTIIDTMYDVLENLGFKNGSILEPSAGIGNFIGYMPSKMRSNSKISAVELDNITGNILKYLYDDANTQIKGIQDAIIADNSQDVVISNVPFGNFKIFDKAFKGQREFLTKRIHNYFFAKALDKVREGGIVMFVTSKGVLDSKGNRDVREYLDKNADFLGAVRLPSTAFQNNANTSVVTDIIILRKNTTGEKKNPNFLDVVDLAVTDKSGEVKTITINKFFAENRNVLLGEIVPGGMYSEKDYSLADPDNKMGQMWDRVSEMLYKHKNTYQPAANLNATNRVATDQDLIENTKIGNLTINKDGKILKRVDSEMQAAAFPAYVKPKNVKKYIDLRVALFDLITAEYIGQTDTILDNLRKRLNTLYSDSIQNIPAKEFNRIAAEDGDGFNVLSLTDKSGKRADILLKRTINPLRQRQNTDSVDEAIIISLYENAKVDMERISDLMQKPVKEILELSKGKIFESPTGGFFTRDEYLSGNVKKKLAEVKKAIESGYSEFEYNKTELEAVIPKDIPVVSIEARLGSRWVPLDIINDFAQHLFNDSSISINYAKSTDTYNNNGRSASVNAIEKWGTKRRNGADLLIDALHIATPAIFDVTEDKKRILNKPETEKAIQKYEEIRTEFENWVYRDADRRDRLGKIYNEKYNTTVRRKYDGSHLNIPGINGVNLYPHQKDAIWMLLQNGGGIIDHIVGAGKTFVMVAGTAEMKRTGVAKKPMILALKSTIPQIVETYKQAYPLAKILAPSEKDFEAKNRQQLFSQIALNDWDVIIISHENYQAIPHHPDYIRKGIDDEIEEIEAERDALEGDKKALSGLETRLKNLKAKLDKLTDVAKDNSVYFQQMGVDHIMVDESQQFKNLAYMTKQRNVAGLSKAEGSQRAFNLLLGIRYLQEKLGSDKGTTFLSGTPISNSMVEMYSLLKYIRPNKMTELGFNTFDQWATTFANPTNEIEYTVTGQFKSKTRFREFINVPELSLLYNEIADVRNDDNLVLDKPKMKGDGYSTVFIPMNDEQRDYGERIIEFAKTKDGNVLGLNLSENQLQAYMLVATNLSSKMAIDMRLINKDYAYDPSGKVGKMTDEVVKVYGETTEHKGTQLIFSDLGTPKNKNNQSQLLKDYLEDEMGVPQDTLVDIFGNFAEEGHKYQSINVIKDKMINALEIDESEFNNYFDQAKQSGETFNLYTDIKQRLIEKGIPENEIVFIHDYNNQRAKEKLFEKINAGEIRVVLGSTQKLGTGVNVQKRLSAIHHLDVPWRPSDMEQRNGRGLRQGNWIAKAHLNNEIPVYAYATEKTLDGYKYQLLQTKQRFLDQVKSGNVEDRVIKENSEEGSDAYAIFVAELSGNKDILIKFKLEQEKDRLIKQKRNFDAQLYEAQGNIKKIEGNMPTIQENIDKTQVDIDAITGNADYEITVDKDGVESKKLKINNINGEVLLPAKDSKEAKEKKPIERTEYGKKAIDLIEKAKLTNKAGEYKKIFEINGIPFLVRVTTDENAHHLLIKEHKVHLALLSNYTGNTYIVNYSSVPGVLLNSIQKTIESLPSILELQKKVLDKNGKDLESYKELVKNDKFPKEKELLKVIDDLKDVDNRIQDFGNDAAEASAADTNAEAGGRSLMAGPNFMIAGEQGAAAMDKAEGGKVRMQNLAVAKEMTGAGMDAKAIRLATGWEMGADGMWKYEVPDGKLKKGWESGTTLADVFEGGELFKAYPQLKDVQIGALEVNKNEDEGGMYFNKQIDDKPTIHVMAQSEKSARAILIHEIQHAIQDIEGFAKGGTAASFMDSADLSADMRLFLESAHDTVDTTKGRAEIDKRLAEFSKMEMFSPEEAATIKGYLDGGKGAITAALRGAYERYKSLSGEVEARNVQTRAAMSADERRATLLSDTADMGKDRQEARFMAVMPEVVNGFYSPLEKVINESKQDKMPAKQWSEKYANSDEARWTGLKDWLSKQPGSVSKGEIQQYLNDNRIEIKEVEKGGTKTAPLQILQDNGGRFYVTNIETSEPISGAFKTWKEASDFLMEQKKTEATQAKFSKDQLAGKKENYKEVLVTISAIGVEKSYKQWLNENWTGDDTQHARDLYKLQLREGENLFPSHFDEPNILVRLRMNTRTDVDGNKVLFLEEIQSNAGQGKKKGTVSWEAPLIADLNAWTKLGLKVALKEAVKQGADKIAWTTGDQQNDRYDLGNGVNKIDVEKVAEVPTLFFIDIKMTDGSKYNLEVENGKVRGKKRGFDSGFEGKPLEDVIGKDIAEKILNGESQTIEGKDMKGFYGSPNEGGLGIIGNVAKGLFRQEPAITNIEVNGKYEKPRLIKDEYYDDDKGAWVVKFKKNNGESERHFNNKEDADKYYESKKNEGISTQHAITITPEPKASVVQGQLLFMALPYAPTTNEQKAIAGQFTAAEAELKAAKSAYEKKRSELMKGYNQSVVDLFGQTPEQRGTQQKLFDQKPQLGAAEKALAPYRQRAEKANNELSRLYKAYTGMEKQETKQMALFMAGSGTSLNPALKATANLLYTGNTPARVQAMLTPSYGAQMAANLVANAQRMVAAMPNNSIIGGTNEAYRNAGRSSKESAIGWWQKMFTSSEGMAPYFKELAEYSTGESKWLMRKSAAFVKNRLAPAFKTMRAVQKEGFMDLIKDLTTINAFTSTLTPEMKVLAGEFRQNIDRMTQEFVVSGWVTPDLAVTLLANMGQYLNRSYRIFNEEGYYDPKTGKSKIPKQVMTDAANFFREQHLLDGRPMQEAERAAEQDLHRYLTEASADKFGMKAYMNSSRDNGIFKSKTDVPEPLRRLLGEYTDPSELFMMTMARMAALRGQSKYLQALYDAGVGSVFFSPDDLNADPMAKVKIAGDDNQSWSPLNGMMTTPEVAEFLKQLAPSEPNILLKTYYRVGGFVKMGKTVYSPVTQGINMVSNIGWHVANGYFFRNAANHALDVGLSFKLWWENMGKQTNEGALSEWNRKMVSLGLYESSVGVADIKRMFAKGDVEQIMIDAQVAIMAGVAGKARRLVSDNWITRNYQLADACSKFVAFRAEGHAMAWALHDKNYEDLTTEEMDAVDKLAAERVKNTQPTAQRAYKGALWLSKNTFFVGNFLTYQAESIRCSRNIIAYALKDMRSPNGKVRMLGARRMAGAVAFVGMKSSVIYYMSQLAGMAMSGFMSLFNDDDDDTKKTMLKAINNLGPDWLRANNKYATIKEDGTWEVYNLDAIDPMSIVFKTMNALTNGGEIVHEPGVVAAAAEILNPFVEADMVSGSIVNNFIKGEDAYGRPLVGFGEKVQRFGQDLLPSAVSFAQRRFRRKDGTVADWHEIVSDEYDLVGQFDGLELLGIRSYKMDPLRSFRTKMYDALDEDNKLRGKLYDVAYRLEKARISDADAALETADLERRQQEIGEKMADYKKYAIATGVTEETCNDIIKKTRQIKVFSKETRKTALQE